jgi:pyrroline-5-carboxylate reductase
MGTIVGVVGAGNMGAALVRGWLRASGGHVSLLIYDVVQERVDELALDDRVRAAASLEELAREAQVILLVVKPKDTGEVLERLRPHLDEGKIVVSSAAGLALDSIRSGAGNAASVFRIMPNLGVEMGQGVVAVATETVTKAEITERILELLAPLGLVELMTEDLFDAITAVSGSSIAFLALALEGLEDGAVRVGLPRPTARAFVRQTALAGSLLLQRHPGSAADVKDQVSSPAGTTIAGLAVLEDAGVRGAFLRAVEEAAERARALRDAARPRALE